MDYTTAKRLKDSGFKSVGLGTYVSYWNGNQMEEGKIYPSNEVETLYHPTLSELIEACGKDFAGLMAPDWEGKLGNDWDALRNNAVGTSVCVSGSTPEEAVAALYLALNKK